LAINDGELACDLAGPEDGQDSFFAPGRGYDHLKKAPFKPVATVTGISSGKKRLAGTQVTRFGAGKQLRRQPFGQARQYGRGRRLRHRGILPRCQKMRCLNLLAAYFVQKKRWAL